MAPKPTPKPFKRDKGTPKSSQGKAHGGKSNRKTPKTNYKPTTNILASLGKRYRRKK